MKKIYCLLLLLPLLSNAQSADEIIQRYSKAMGGLDAFNKVTSAKITGSLISQGMNLPLTIYIINGKSMRTDVEVNGQMISNVYDKGKGWKVNPYESISSPTEVTSPDELALLKIQASIANNLMDYKMRGHTVEYKGQEVLDGVAADKINLLSRDDGKTTVFFISTTDHKLLRSDSKQKIQGNEYDAQTFYKDFRTINGIVFSTHFVRKIQGNVFQEVKFDNVELNVPVDEKIFLMPGK